MNTGAPRTIVVTGGVNYQTGECYQRRGPAQGLIVLDMGVEPAELRKILASFPKHYAGLFVHSPVSRHTAGEVPIELVLDQERYQTLLKKGPRSEGAWIPSGSVVDKAGRDIKLAGFFNRAGLAVQRWTNLAIAGNLPRRYPPLQSVSFVVDGRRWTFLRNASDGLGQSR